MINFEEVLGAEVLQKYGIVTKGKMQGTRAVIYDKALFTSGATMQTAFWNVVRAGNVNNAQTNFTQNGAFLSSQAFIITGISVAFGTVLLTGVGATPVASELATNVIAGVWDDIGRLLFWGNLLNHFAGKSYGEYPLWRIPGGGGPSGGYSKNSSGTAAATVYEGASWATNGVPHYSNVMPGVWAIPGGVEMWSEMRWDGILTLGSNRAIMLMFDGFLLRPVA